jgi:hypothetical protein
MAMEEIEKYADLLSLLGTGEEPKPQNTAIEEDTEILEWASLFSKANAGVIRKARLRICSAGLLAVHRHIASNPV